MALKFRKVSRVGFQFLKAAPSRPQAQDQGQLALADDGIGEVPSPEAIQKLSDRLDLEEARTYDDYDQATDQLARHHHAMVDVDQELTAQIDRLTPIAEGVVYGDLPLDQGNARAIIRWKDLLVRRNEVRMARRMTWGATKEAGVGNQPGELLG